VQLGHAGPKGSTNAPWQGDGADRPLAAGNWPLLAASALPYLDGGQAPRAMTRADMDRVRDDFVTPRAGRPKPASTGWNCIAPTATCCRASSRR
jgi:anthraniloyl-CoA monooxygenase